MSTALLELAGLGLHPGRLGELLTRWGNAERTVAAIRGGRVDGVDAGSIVPADAVMRQLELCGARPVFLGEPGYPELLAAIEDPPPTLFVRGAIPSGPAVAVVGTRRATAYGRALARAFGGAVADAGWVLVSGLARGIDGEAHRGSLHRAGAGIGVLGCGPDIVYPREHGDIADDLIAGGAVVSEYPPGAAPLAWRFPPRNRIISGLAGAVVVVEAGVAGGALVTAARAVAQGREVFAVPGDVDRETSVGCNLLIRDGAVPVLGASDLIEALSLVLGPPRSAPSADDLPSAGISLDALAVRLGLEGSSFATWLGRMRLAGRIRVVGDRVHPQDPARRGTNG